MPMIAPTRHCFFSFLCLMAFWAILLAGCATKKRYDYNAIKTEFMAAQTAPDTEKKAPFKPEVKAPSGPLSLVEAIKIAMNNNPEIDMAVARIRQSEAMIAEATASFWPVISTYWEYMQGDAPSAYLFKTIDQRNLPPGVNFNDPGWFDNYEVGVRGRINVFNGGRDLLRRRMAETGLNINELDRQSVENALIASAIDGYFSVLAAQDFVQIARESESSVEKQLKIMEVRYRGGSALKSDVLSLEVSLAQTREELVRAENNHSLSLAAFANLLGLDPDTRMTFEKKAKIPVDLPPDYQAGLVQALANRPELLKVRQQIIQSRMALDVARAEYLPRLDVQARAYWDDADWDFSNATTNWTAGIILNWDLFTGFSTKARVNKETGVLEEMIAADRKATLSVQLDLKTAYLKVAEAEARLSVSQASVAQAEESLRLVTRQYEGGAATITRYLEAELARNRARIRTTASFYDREKAMAAVGRALGYWAKYAEKARTDYD